jgi:hypothetical protein
MSSNIITKFNKENSEESKKNQNQNIYQSPINNQRKSQINNQDNNSINTKNSEKSKEIINKINNELKNISDHIASVSKRSTVSNGNLENIFTKIITKDLEIQNLNNKESIIHHIDLIGLEQPIKKYKQNFPNSQRKNQSAFISPIRKSTERLDLNVNLMKKIGSEFSLTPNHNRKGSSNVNSNFNENAYSYSKNLNINDYDFYNNNNNKNLGIELNDTMKIKRDKIRSLENNPKKMRFYEKNLFHMQKKDLEIILHRDKLIKGSNLNLKKKPDINKNSQKIMKIKYNDDKKKQLPLYMRIDEVIQSKNNSIHKLKKYHKEETNSKLGDYSLNINPNDKSSLSKLVNLTNLENNFEFTHLSKNTNINSVKNTTTNFNNKFFNLNKSTSSIPRGENVNGNGNGNNNCGSAALLNVINDLNNDILNISGINPMNKNTIQNSNSKTKSENNIPFFKNKLDDMYSYTDYIEFLNQKKNKDENENEKNNKKEIEKEKEKKDEENKLKKFKEFEGEEYQPFEIHYQQRTLDWVKNKEIWEKKKKDKIEENKKIMEIKDLPENKGFFFKPKINSNSQKIINEKRSHSQSQTLLNNYNFYNFNNKENNNFDHLIEDNLSNSNNSYYNYDNNILGVQNPNGNNNNNNSVFENLYRRRFDSAVKREKILQETTFDFKPKLNNKYYYNNNNTIIKNNTNKNKNKNNIPIPKNDKYLNTYSNIYNNNDEKNNRIKKIRDDRNKSKKRNHSNSNNNNYNYDYGYVYGISKGKIKEKSLMEKLEELEIENINHENKNKSKSKNNFDVNNNYYNFNADANGKKKIKNEIKNERIDTGDLYKLNIVNSSAWDLNKENNAYSDVKFTKIISKVGNVKF